jgi:hypothetical protein
MTHLPPPWSRDYPGTIVPTAPPPVWRPDAALSVLRATGVNAAPPTAIQAVAPSGKLLRPALWGKL